ncbi:MAG: PD-(D/E)XK nuclease family transposase [Lachnospiraceae bacterium]|nr:PD-(D/E)XK nuclease family transposase [Lachnospiraceae bacterium]
MSTIRKKKTAEQIRQENIEKLRSFRLFDDTYMTRFFNENIPCTEFVLRILMNKPDLKVETTRSQVLIRHLEGRSVYLDVYATDSQGKKYDIEVQRSDSGADPHRARYHSSIIDVDNLHAGEDFDKLPDSYVIFITENDIWEQGVPVYQIERMNLTTGKPFGDGSHILYVNGTYRDDSEIGKLMHDFSCPNPSDMYYGVLAERASFLKEREEGVTEMCKIMDEMMREAAADAVQEERYDIVVNMLTETELSKEQIARLAKVTVEEVEELEKELQVQ